MKLFSLGNSLEEDRIEGERVRNFVNAPETLVVTVIIGYLFGLMIAVLTK